MESFWFYMRKARWFVVFMTSVGVDVEFTDSICLIDLLDDDGNKIEDGASRLGIVFIDGYKYMTTEKATIDDKKQ